MAELGAAVGEPNRPGRGEQKLGTQPERDGAPTEVVTLPDRRGEGLLERGRDGVPIDAEVLEPEPQTQDLNTLIGRCRQQLQ